VSVTAAAGYTAAAATAGLKDSGGPDVALVVNTGPADAAAGVFTRNRVQAAPVRWSREVLRRGRARAVLVNSGNANACTGPAGFQLTHASAETAAGALGIGAGEVVVCSTGVIGVPLDGDRLLAAVGRAAGGLSGDGGAAAAEAILTTDTVAKQAVRSADGVTVGGMAKGAAMLAPGLATMLCVLTTDADVAPADLQVALARATAGSFDRIDSDGCMSTNDTVVLLANAAAGLAPTPARFAELVEAVCADLAAQLLADCEGAGHEVAVEVTGAASVADALEVARALARNTLLKCALAGNDPYWGRVLAAAGTTAAAFDPDRLDVAFNGVWVCRGGTAVPGAPAVDISARTVRLCLDLHAGAERATVWTTDLTTEYVHLNADYTT
jgi:glutamate N-acetyltransferase/amino-acid N-acetyltransferase